MKNLHDRETAIEFYDARYDEGYMEEWDEGKKAKVREILRSLSLPSRGKALDFGCGNGVFTKVLKECLPGWDVFGVEISRSAVSNAKKKFTECFFFHAADSQQYFGQFDFLFSHHVIEHVPDLVDTFQTINAYLKPVSSQLHILPCGNEGSFEFNICKLRKGGIEKENGNRFFFEEPGHLRRLTTLEFERFENNIGFSLVTEYYANQYVGAINWITKSSPRFVKKITSTERAVDEKARVQLGQLRKQLLPLTYFQFPFSKFWQLRSKWKKSKTDYIKLAVLFFPGLFSRFIYQRLEQQSNKEWEKRKTERSGSEMFLFFKR